MALNKDEHENLLKEIAMTGGDTDNMLKLLQRLRDDFDEREGMLRKEGEERDKESPDTGKEREEIREESEEDDKEDKGLRRDPLSRDMVSRKEYDDLKRKYIERFFGTPESVMREQTEDAKKDAKSDELSYDDLFKEREG